MARQALAERRHAHQPTTGVVETALELHADARRRRTAPPAFARRRPLVAIAAQEVGALGGRVAQVAEADDVDAVRSVALIVVVVEALDPARRAGAEMVVHQ